MKISVIGIGVMGEPIARNLQKAGMDVTVYCRTPATRQAFEGSGIATADSATQAITVSDTVILLVPSGQEVDQVLGCDARGHISAPLQDKTVILMATVAPSYSLALARAVQKAGGRYIEAPLSGSRKPAETGQLVVLASATNEAWIDDAMPVFDAIGKKTVRCGAVPTAMRMKLANQLLLVATFEAISEATHFARESGLDVDLFIDMALAGPLANDVLRMKAPKLLADDFAQQAPIRHVSKDIGLVCDEAELRGLWVPIAQANRDLFKKAMQRGLANDDAIGIVKVLREKAEL
ncbi:NAD(P)-dependent oxidoreductase [Paracidovorax anthurii]|uniref:3-hydroxyisobutyrate dehydrogenase n=1 Tax=Paracidovorax anthurii TaxID=78229 RepID=A0A328ZBW4_9BURK|nr:NAD(P)-dependent oxidoreductase [Paracidovorax anthurii]RAR83561.1 3-hydroxyisobutyrate dehydrogenase [Paracidovorax anthurii]